MAKQPTLRDKIYQTGNVWIPANEVPDEKDVVRYQGRVTSKWFAAVEDRVAIKALTMAVNSCDWCEDDSRIAEYINEYEKENYPLHRHQRDAVHMIVHNDLCVLTGGPGTGKTTSINCAAYVLRRIRPDASLLFCAPTGKAARRITESTGEKASTLHHLLGLGYNETKPKNIEGDVLFMDESSMNDIELTDKLFEICLNNKKLVWIGDVDQIPSVGPGNVLKDFIASGVIPTTMLTKTFRQAGESALLDNINKVRAGDGSFRKDKPDDPDAEFLESIFKEDARESQIDYIVTKAYLKARTKYGADNVAVLLPYRKAGYCSDHVNQILQSRVNGKGPAWRCFPDKENNPKKVILYRKGDPVMQLVNRSECVNGEVGKVVEVGDFGVKVKYSSGIVTYDTEEIKKELTLAYAMSVTKSQGSEYQAVILVILDSHTNALNKNILYTGMSRAKKFCHLLTQQKAIETSLKETASNRVTLLSQKLSAMAS